MNIFTPNTVIESEKINENFTEVLETVYPVGSVYISVASTNPNTLFGFGTWTAFASGRVLVGINAGDADFAHAEHEAGGKTHSHTTGGASADHSHGYTVITGSATGIQYGTSFGLIGTASNTGGVSADHSHSMGSGTADSTVQPSIAVYMWKRTA